jgi:dipeptidase E
MVKMRLYLSSYRLGDRAGALLALLGGARPHAAIIANALDNVPPEARRRRREEIYDPARELASLGITSAELDLRGFFGQNEALSKELVRYDLVWVIGGNAFTLRRAMKLSGFDTAILAMLDRDAIVYGGFSAGAVVAGPSLDGFETMDDPDELPVGYGDEPVRDGLNLIDFAIIPHYRSPHPEAAAAERCARHFARNGRPFRALRDGEAIVWTGMRAGATGDLRRIA